MPYLLADDRRFPLKSGMNFLGRDPICNIFLPDPHISRKHASIDLVSDGTMTLIDLGSTNGILVNGERVASAILHPGDTFVVGQTTFSVGKDRVLKVEMEHTPGEDEVLSEENTPSPTAEKAEDA
jgi:pSer/pThr/pTyr-binding forkhead associated (FHA) protein